MFLRIMTVIAGISVSLMPLSASEIQDAYFEKISALCGQAFSGAVVKDNRNDPSFAGKKIILHIRDCSDSEIRMPMHVGDDHSRTFILNKVSGGLQFKHDHRHQDGSPDTVTLYGGITASEGSEHSQDFPVDEETKTLFSDNGLNVSLTNVWTFSLVSGQSISYILKRPNRDFQIKFDMKNTVANPPKAWGVD